jgi:hypothetical protein
MLLLLLLQAVLLMMWRHKAQMSKRCLLHHHVLSSSCCRCRCRCFPAASLRCCGKTPTVNPLHHLNTLHRLHPVLLRLLLAAPGGASTV